jgi:hypothetical protein
LKRRKNEKDNCFCINYFGIAASNSASADNVRGINIDFVTIGHAGNAPDTQVMDDGTTGYGAVGYDYRIGKYEVTNAQWNTFIAAASAPSGNPSKGYDQNTFYTGANQPTTNVSWYEAAQFCNYLTSGDKGLGAYQLGTDGSITVDRVSAISAYGTVYVIPTEDEWYKAAYYKPDGSGYSLYANGLNTVPSPNGWNYAGDLYINTPWDVGTGTEEQNGTFDMMGNVWEWNETLFDIESSVRSARGGSFYVVHNDYFTLASTARHNMYPYDEYWTVGFRIASVSKPDPIGEILDFIDKSVADGNLAPVKPGPAGEGQLGALINMVKTAGELIKAEDMAGACGQLNAALRKTDGQATPPDFVTGPASTELAQMIQDLMTSLGCS